MTPIIAIANHKGGAGKTTSAYCLAMHLSETMRVLAVDLDDQAGLTSRLVQEPERRHLRLTTADVLLREATIADAVLSIEPGLDLLPADTKLSWAAAKIQAMSPNHMFLSRALQPAGAYDVVILDCPPSADIVIVNALMAATHLIMAATPTVESWDGTNRMRQMVDELSDMTGQAPEVLGIVATQVVVNSKSHQSYIVQMRDSLIGCVPMRVGVDAPAQLMQAYAPIAARVREEAGRD